MKNIIIVFLISTLFFISISANALNLKNVNIENDGIETLTSGTEVYVGIINVYCEEDDDLAVEINIEESPYRKINPQGSEEVMFKFYLDWHIINQQVLNFDEKWYFEIVIKEGGSPDSPVIDTKTLTVSDSLFGPQEDGTLYSKEISLKRISFEKDDFFNEPETKSFRAEIRGAYYHDKGDTTIDDDDSWTVTRIDLENERPTIPTLTGDIDNGGQGSVETTYSFTASGSNDPDGDEIIYYDFDFHDGTVDSISPSGGSATASHKWSEKGEKTVTVYAVERFGRISEGAELVFTLPKTKSFTNTRLVEILKINFPQLNELFKKLC